MKNVPAPLERPASDWTGPGWPMRILLPYGIAMLAVAVVHSILLWAQPQVEMTVPLAFLTAVMIGAWYGGFGPGIFATFFSTLLIHLAYLSNRPSDREAVELTEFVVAGLVITALTWQLQRSLRLAQSEHASYVDLVQEIDAIVWEARIGERGLEFTFVNRRLETLLGRRPELWLSDSTHFTRHLTPDDLDHLLALCREGGSAELELRIPSSEGRPVWFRTQIRGSKHPRCTLRGIMVDITERQRFLAAVEESERRFRLLAENARDVVFRYRLEPNRGFEYINPAATSVFGYAPEDFYSDPELWFRMVDPNDRPALESLLSKHVEPTKTTVHWRRRDEAWIWTEIYLNVVRDELGRATALEGIARDVTERKRHEDIQRLIVEITAAANEAPDLPSATRRCLEIICRLEHWDLGLGWFPSDRDGTLACLADLVVDPRVSAFRDACLRRTFLKGRGLVGMVWQADSPLWIADVREYSGFLRSAAAAECGLTSAFAFPIRFGRTLLSVFEFFSIDRRDVDRAIVEAFDRLGVHLSVIFERKEAEARERAARREAEESQQRMAFLAEASELLDTSLDYNRTLSNVARLAISRLADWCSIFLVRDGGTLELVNVVHAEPSRLSLAQHLQEQFPQDPGDPIGIYHVLRTGKSQIYPQVTDDLLRRAAKTEEHLKILRELSLVSAMLVPLRVRQTTLGVISFASTRPERRYGQADLDMAEALALRAAQAIQNSKLYREAQEAVRTREEFLSIAAHELKTPLTTLQLQLQNLIRTARRGEMKLDALENAAYQGRRLGHLIGNLLDVSRISAGRMELDRETMDLSVAVHHAVERLREQFTRSGSPVDIHADRPVPGFWDRLRIEQVIVNLLSNAIKYGQGRPISISVDAADATARITVQDRGIGIPTEARSRLFAPFERAVSSRHYSGLGLGLYIVHQIVKAHGGSIRVQSEPGAGSTFIVELPRTAGERPNHAD